tara:strand:- start:113 stop:517 length:405 start_codon:yes stop_codon:yes gene_type:complete
MNFDDIFSRRDDDTTITAHYNLDETKMRAKIQMLLPLTRDEKALDTTIINSVIGLTDTAEEGVVAMYLVMKATLHLINKESEKINELVKLQTAAMQELEETDYDACASYNAIMVRMILDNPLLSKDFDLTDEDE